MGSEPITFLDRKLYRRSQGWIPTQARLKPCRLRKPESRSDFAWLKVIEFELAGVVVHVDSGHRFESAFSRCEGRVQFDEIADQIVSQRAFERVASDNPKLTGRRAVFNSRRILPVKLLPLRRHYPLI